MRRYLELLRAHHWIKNAAVLVALPFGWLEFGASCTTGMVLAVIAFCLASSAVYALNDVLDRAEDLHHPVKRNRPVARGAIAPGGALLFALLLALAALGVSLTVPGHGFLLAVAAYLVLMIAYTLALKHQAVLDVIVIACGFVLRTVGGAAAVGVFVSPWLVVCTFTLCLFLGFGKRRSEVHTINHVEAAARHRRTLPSYTPDLLNQLLSTSAGVALVTFLLYIMDRDPLPGQTVVYEKRALLYTFPLVAYGLFRYAILVETGKVSGPTDIILKDRPLLVLILIWILTCSAIIMLNPVGQWLGG